MELINKQKFAKAALEKNFNIFIVYVAVLAVPQSAMQVDSSWTF